MNDWAAYILFKLAGPLARLLPKTISFFFGRAAGIIYYYIDYKHRSLAYAQIKMALGDTYTCAQLKSIVKAFYMVFGQNVIEMFFIPLITPDYIKKYIRIEGMEHVYAAFKRGKGVIFLGVHAGSWELSNIICGSLGFPFNLFVRDQRLPRLETLLTEYRRKKGCKIIQRQNQIRELIRVLQNNEGIGITQDQGGKTGILVDFFGRQASMPYGAVRLALKYDAALLPAFYTRIKGPYLKIIVAPPYSPVKTGRPEEDLRVNVQALTDIFAGFIRKYPKEYLWTYKIWKYGLIKKIVILADEKTGHSRQSQAAAEVVRGIFRQRGFSAEVAVVPVVFNSSRARKILVLASAAAGKYSCQGCLRCLRYCLTPGSFAGLQVLRPDVVISCGSGLAAVNYLVTREYAAKNIVILKPSFLSLRRYNAVIMPQHDHPPRKKNVIVTRGALNMMDETCLREQSALLVRGVRGGLPGGEKEYVGVLIGGDTKSFTLGLEAVKAVAAQVKLAAERLNMEILITTSRRTSPSVEGVLKREFQDYPRCSLLVIANEKNIPGAVGGILGLSSLVVTSPESISMVSESASSGKYTVVFSEKGLSRKHREFLRQCAGNRYIYLADPQKLSEMIKGLLSEKPAVVRLDDRERALEALNKLL